MGVSKVRLNGDTLMDVTTDTVASNNLLSGKTATGADGEKVNGGIAAKASSDLTASGATVTAPAGYYASNASKSVASGTAGTPTASKGSVSNHAITVTPSVTNTAGYISGGTKTGTGVSVTVAELESGTKTITDNGTGISVSGYSAVDVDVAGSGGASHTVTIGRAGNTSCYVRLTSESTTTKHYTAGESIPFSEGDQLYFFVFGSNMSQIFINNQRTNYYQGGQPVTNTLTLGDHDVVVDFTTGTSAMAFAYETPCGDILQTDNLGALSTTSTTSTDTGKTVTVSGINSYDALMVVVNGAGGTNYLGSTSTMIYLTASSDIDVKTGAAVDTRVLLHKITTQGDGTSNSQSTAYGIFPYSCAISNGTATITLYMRYNSSYTGNMNSSWVCRVFGLKL